MHVALGAILDVALRVEVCALAAALWRKNSTLDNFGHDDESHCKKQRTGIDFELKTLHFILCFVDDDE